MDELDPEPLGTASIAQVHRGRLVDGREVVVKVQRPDIDWTVRADLNLLRTLAKLLDATVEEAALYRPTELVDAFEVALLDELDFCIEARNARAIAANFEGDERVLIPATIDELSCQKILVLEYMEGVKITQMGPEHDQEAILMTLLDILFQMGFVDGLFHADPHPGNVMVSPDGRICLLDFGLVGRLTSNMQHKLMQLILAMVMRDAEMVARLMLRLGRPIDRITLGDFRDHIADLMNRFLARRLDEVDAAGLTSALIDTAHHFRIRTVPAYALLGKASATLEGIVRQIKPDLDISGALLPFVQHLMMERYSPKALKGMALRAGVGVLDAAQELPLIAYQLLDDLEAGRMTLRASHPELDRLGRSFTELGLDLFLGLVTLGLIGGSFLHAAMDGPWVKEGLQGSAVLILWVLLRHLKRTRIKKLSIKGLRRWLRR